MRAECRVASSGPEYEDMHAWCRGPEEVTAGSYVVTRFPCDCECHRSGASVREGEATRAGGASVE